MQNVVVRGRCIWSMAAPVASHGGDCPEKIHIFAILAGISQDCAQTDGSGYRSERQWPYQLKSYYG